MINGEIILDDPSEWKDFGILQSKDQSNFEFWIKVILDQSKPMSLYLKIKKSKICKFHVYYS